MKRYKCQTNALFWSLNDQHKNYRISSDLSLNML